MKYPLFLVLCILSIPCSWVFSQTADSTGNKIPPDRYIEYMSNYINLKLSHTSDVDELSVITQDNDIYLRPNASSFSNLSFNYRFISFSIKYIPKWLPGNDDNDEKGKTKGSGFGLNLNFDRWMQDLSYSKTKGYYLENTADYDPSWKEGDPYIQFPELQFVNFQGVSAFKFNRNFSINAVASQTERQVKSAGSFIPHLIYRYYIIEDKANTQSGQKSNNFEILLGAGYYHSFVLKNNFYISLGATPGAGGVFTKLTTRLPSGNIYTNQNNFIFRLDGKAGIGYNGRRFFAGAYSKISTSTIEQQNTSVVNQDTRFVVQGFVGYRLNAPKWMREKVETVEKMIPL